MTLTGVLVAGVIGALLGAVVAAGPAQAGTSSWNYDCRAAWDSYDALSQCRNSPNGEVKLNVVASWVDWEGDWMTAMNGTVDYGACWWECVSANVSRRGV